MDSNEVEVCIREMSETFARNNDPDLFREFLPCLLTSNELKEVASRWALVKMIDDGISQRTIAAELGLSLCKITRGSKELKKDKSPFKRMIDLSRDSREK
jgi:TrpR family transcriptional regulator, trp operon repressor